jgi:pectate lyase
MDSEEKYTAESQAEGASKIEEPKKKSKLFKAIIILIVVLVLLAGGFYLRRQSKIGDRISTPNPTIEPSGQSEDYLSGIPIFPGAEGFGTLTPAGRGGKIIAVTSLADSGSGTLREALNDQGPRTIVFNISGIIELEKEIQINNPFVTIAGQTAPGDGITLIKGGLSIFTHDVLVQHIRIRPGDQANTKPDNSDAISILDAQYENWSNTDDYHESPTVYNIVLDHVSTSWAEDETISIWIGTHDVTVSNSIISEPLLNARHPKGPHSMGLLIGDKATRVSVHHNLIAHSNARNPLIKDGGTHDIINNVFYNWGQFATEVLDYNSNTLVNFVKNLYIRGFSSDEKTKEITLQTSTPDPKYPGRILVEISDNTPQFYLEDNRGPNKTNATSDFIQQFQLKIDTESLAGNTAGEKIESAKKKFFVSQAFSTPTITTVSVDDVRDYVLARVGATKPKRDSVDSRIVNQVKTGTGRIIDSQSEVGGYPFVSPISREANFDTDRDGMPDSWEIERGFDPNNSADGTQDKDEDGYTNVEEYLHELGGYK